MVIYREFFPLKMVIFHSYVSLPEGSHVMCVNLAVENRGHGNLVSIKLAIFPMAPMATC